MIEPATFREYLPMSQFYRALKDAQLGSKGLRFHKVLSILNKDLKLPLKRCPKSGASHILEEGMNSRMLLTEKWNSSEVH